MGRKEFLLPCLEIMSEVHGVCLGLEVSADVSLEARGGGLTEIGSVIGVEK